jgi:poly(hydroxyalkanoate) depolymerase family esterase
MQLMARLNSLLRRTQTQDFSATRGRHFDYVAPKRNYPGSHKRLYRVYVPPGCGPDRAAPLVMVLHGCQQTHLDIEAISRFDEVADRHHFIVVYPFVTRYFDIRARNCWGWWLRKHISPGSGEVEDLWQIVEDIAGSYNINRRRIHIAGLSSGGAMAIAALTVHVNRFASGAAVAGVAYGERSLAVVSPLFSDKREYTPVGETAAQMRRVRNNNCNSTPLFIVHAEGDNKVQLQAAKNLRDVWLHYFGADKKLIKHTNHSETLGTPWVHTRYSKLLGDSEVETLFLQGLGHGWYGGAPGAHSYTDAPPIADMIWNFFRRHKRGLFES